MTENVAAKPSRADWIATAALVITLAGWAFNVGVVVQTQQDHDRRIADLEATDKDLVPRVERIDANVEFLTELAREQRGERER